MTYQVQIDGVVRDATDDEIKQIEKDRASAAAEKQAQAEALEAKAAARNAVLAKLGLTADEVAALFG